MVCNNCGMYMEWPDCPNCDCCFGCCNCDDVDGGGDYDDDDGQSQKIAGRLEGGDDNG